MYLPSMQLTTLLRVSQIFGLPTLVHSAGNVVTDWSIQSKDITPVLGRGYSVATGNLHSICYDVDMNTGITEPSFDYSYTMTEVNSSTDFSEAVNSKTRTSSRWIKSEVENEARTESSTTQSQSIVGVMAVDKYYISSDESKGDLSPDAISILEQAHFIQFFLACGPSYIRSIRRTSEFVFRFKYTSTTGRDKGVDNYLYQAGSSSFDTSETSDSATSDVNLEIHFRGFGISLKYSKSFQAKTFEDFKKSSDEAFKSMLNPSVGIVSSIEVVPWMGHVGFQAIAQLDAQVGTLAPAMRKFNLVTNSEHVARLDNIMRHRLMTFNRLISCIGALNSLPRDANSRRLNKRYTDCIPGETECPGLTTAMTVQQLRTALLGVSTTGSTETYLMERLSDYMQSYVTNYMGPCLQEMAEEENGIAGGKMQSQHWSEMSGCLAVSCVFSGTRWNAGACIALSETDSKEWIVEEYCLPTLQPV